MEWELSCAEMLRISHDALGQNCAWLILEVACQKWANLARSQGFLQNQLDITEGEGLFYDDFALDSTRKHEKNDFEEFVCQVNCVLPCDVFSEIDDKRKVLLYYFRTNGYPWVFYGVFSLFGMSRMIGTVTHDHYR